jgi:hypothetical protein
MGGPFACPLLAPATRRYHAGMYSLLKQGYGPETMRAVATAYRHDRQASRLNSRSQDAFHRAALTPSPARKLSQRRRTPASGDGGDDRSLGRLVHPSVGDGLICLY